MLVFFEASDLLVTLFLREMLDREIGMDISGVSFLL